MPSSLLLIDQVFITPFLLLGQGNIQQPLGIHNSRNHITLFRLGHELWPKLLLVWSLPTDQIEYPCTCLYR
jgi:hypothetical protein